MDQVAQPPQPQIDSHLEERPLVVDTPAVGPPPCYFWKACSARAALEKAGRSVCRRCAAHLCGVEYPLREASIEPIYLTPRAAAEALDMVSEQSPRSIGLFGIKRGRESPYFPMREEGTAMFLNALSGYLPTTIRVIVGVALLAVAAFGARSWMAAHDTAVELRATLTAQKQLIEQAAAREKDRDAALAKTLAGISEVKRAVQTPAQAAENLSQALPALPEPIQIQVPAPEPGKDAAPSPATASVPQPDLVPLYDYLEDCRACQAQLTAKNNDLTDEHTKVTALTAERDAAVRAARGGGFWARTRRAAKWLLIGGAIGAVAATAARQH